MGFLHVVYVTLALRSMQTSEADGGTIPCPFAPNDCLCTIASSDIVFESAICIPQDGKLPTFEGSSEYTIDGELSIFFDASKLDQDSFAAFTSIKTLTLVQPGPTPLTQEWSQHAFRGPIITGLKISGVSGVIPPPAAVLEIGNSLTELRVIDCGETVVLDASIFSSYIYLKLLEIKDTRISTIHSSAFAGLEDCLEEIVLQNDSLSAVPVDALAPLNALRSIDLAYNNMNTFSGGEFSIFPQLEVLILDGSNVQAAINADAFSNLPRNLSLLSVRESIPPFTTVPQGLISAAANVAMLSLAKNYISALTFTDFSQLYTWRILDLSANPISTIKRDAFLFLDTVRHLDISETQLESFDLSLLEGMNDLVAVRVAGTATLKSLKISDLDQVPTAVGEIDASELTSLQLLDPQFDSLLHRDNFRTFNISGSTLDCTPDISWMAAHVLCKPYRIVANDTNCKNGESLNDYLSQQVPNACRAPVSDTSLATSSLSTETVTTPELGSNTSTSTSPGISTSAATSSTSISSSSSTISTITSPTTITSTSSSIASTSSGTTISPSYTDASSTSASPASTTGTSTFASPISTNTTSTSVETTSTGTSTTSIFSSTSSISTSTTMTSTTPTSIPTTSTNPTTSTSTTPTTSSISTTSASSITSSSPTSTIPTSTSSASSSPRITSTASISQSSTNPTKTSPIDTSLSSTSTTASGSYASTRTSISSTITSVSTLTSSSSSTTATTTGTSTRASSYSSSSSTSAMLSSRSTTTASISSTARSTPTLGTTYSMSSTSALSTTSMHSSATKFCRNLKVTATVITLSHVLWKPLLRF